MRMMYRVLLAGAALAAMSGCDKQQSNRPDAIQAQLDELDKQGLIIEGFQDVEGIKRVVGKFANDINKQNAKIDAQMRGAMDARDAAEFAKMARELALANLAVESIEFVPGLSGPKGSNPEDVIRGLHPSSEWGGAPENEFVPGFPSLGSFAGYDFGGRGITSRISYDSNGNRMGTSWYLDTPNGRIGGFKSDDGDLIMLTHESQRPDGTVDRTVKVVFGGRFYATIVSAQNDSGGVRVTKYANGDAKKEVYTDGEWRDLNRADDTGSESTESTEELPPNPYNEIQPSDGMGGGRFCPLTLDICRRAMDRALASREKVQAGVILINPGDPDLVPSAPRLKFDTGGLVINPSPDAGVNTTRDPRKFRMRLPVWVLPPKPIFGGSNANAPTPSN